MFTTVIFNCKISLNFISITRICTFRLKKLEQTSQSLTLGIEKNKIVISFKPFRIDFYTEDEPVVSINAQGLLKFEHYRHKQ